MEYLSTTLLPFFRRNLLAALLGMIGLICLGYGLIGFSSQNPKNDIKLISADQQSASESATKSNTLSAIVVDVAGAVNNPGVYHLPEDSRIQDAITAAGGLRNDADIQLISRQINLAMKVTDGVKIYLPAFEEATSSSPSNEKTATSTQININTADESALDSLPGIGKVTAGKIVAARPYTTIEELVDKKVLSQKVFDTIKSQLTTY